MKTTMIDRYIAEIGKRLALRNRADIQKEIRSTLEDMLEDRARHPDRTGEENLVVDLLREFGKPEDVAASYQTERYLVGPQLYPFFSLVVTIVLPILATVLMIIMSIGLFSSIVSLKSLHTKISEDDARLLSEWQKRVRQLTGNKLTLGEVAGLIGRIVEERYKALPEGFSKGDFKSLVDALIGIASEEASGRG
ncbi:MAG: hypothetical protein FJZ96_06960 [Chloroflexi bacterium]|nr:hypothetical protein [Chloroflexota bacterium]